MRKFQPVEPCTLAYQPTRNGKGVTASERKFLRNLLLVVLAIVVLTLFVIWYRHAQGWPIVQK